MKGSYIAVREHEEGKAIVTRKLYNGRGKEELREGGVEGRRGGVRHQVGRLIFRFPYKRVVTK